MGLLILGSAITGTITAVGAGLGLAYYTSGRKKRRALEQLRPELMTQAPAPE